MAVTYEPIASITVGSGGAASVTFGSGGTLPQTYTDLVLVSHGVSEATSAGFYNIQTNFNGDTGSNYSWTTVGGTGSSTFSSSFPNYTYAVAGGLPGVNTTSTKPGTNVAQFMSYSNPNVFKTLLTSSAVDIYIIRSVQLWRSTSAITSITLTATTGDFAEGSTLSLYGIKAA